MHRHNVFSSKLHIFKMDIGGHLGFRGQHVSKSKNNHFICFVTPKIIEFSILYLHLHVYVLLSSKVIVFYVFKMEMDGHLEFRCQAVSKSKKSISLVLPCQK